MVRTTSPSLRTRWSFLLGACGGLATAALLRACSPFPPDSVEILREAWGFHFLGDLATALPLLLLAGTFLHRPWNRARAPASNAWLLGLAFGLLPMASAATDRPWTGILLIPLLAFLALTSPVRWRSWFPAGLATGSGWTALLLLALSLLLPPLPVPVVPLPPQAHSGLEAASRPPGREAPNLVLISLDTTRADLFRGPQALSETLADFASQGMSAPYGLAPAPSTLPSHATLFTGVGVLRHGVRSNAYALPPGLSLLAERLRAAGWRTAAVVANPILDGKLGFSRGFEVWEAFDAALGRARASLLGRAHRSAWPHLLLAGARGKRWRRRFAIPTLPPRPAPRAPEVVDRCLALVEELDPEPTPFFLFLNLVDPHLPYEPLPSLEDPHPRRWVPQDLMGLAAELAAGDPTVSSRLAAAHQAYRAEARAMDAALAPLLARIQQLRRPTVVLVVGDHGEQFGEHGLTRHANSLYEAVLRVPFLLVGPTIPPGSTFRVVPQLEDVAPTLLHLAGLSSSGCEGRDLLATGTKEPPLPAVYATELSLRSGPWKLIARRSEGDPPTLRPLALYRVDRDPGETEDLREREPSRVRSLLDRLSARLRTAPPRDAARRIPPARDCSRSWATWNPNNPGPPTEAASRAGPPPPERAPRPRGSPPLSPAVGAGAVPRAVARGFPARGHRRRLRGRPGRGRKGWEAHPAPKEYSAPAPGFRSRVPAASARSEKPVRRRSGSQSRRARSASGDEERNDGRGR